MTNIKYGVKLESGKVANFTSPVEVANSMYENWSEHEPMYIAPEVVSDGVSLTFFNTALDHELAINEYGGLVIATSGNTVERNCPLKPEGPVTCENCAIAGIDWVERRKRNCARANTVMGFDMMGIQAPSRVMMTPTKSEVFVLDANNIGTAVTTEGELAFHKLPVAEAVLITESAAKELFGEDRFAIGMNGADSTFGVINLEIAGERSIMAFCSTRTNMGDRDEEQKIYKNLINKYLDSRGLFGKDREDALATMSASVTFGASATRNNFRFDIDIDTLSTSVKEAIIIKEREKIGDLDAVIAITRQMVLDHMYPGVIDRGNVFQEAESEMVPLAREKDIDLSVGWLSKCENGVCCIDYYEETAATILAQFNEMGAPAPIIDASRSIDTADTKNNAASHRAERMAGVDKNKTNRTLNAVVVAFGDK